MGDSKADEEMRALAASVELREDLRRLSVRERPMGTEEWLDFVAAYNEFIGHRPRPFRPIEGSNWRFKAYPPDRPTSPATA